MARNSEPSLTPFQAYLSAMVFLQMRNNRRPSTELAAQVLAMVPPPDMSAPPDPTNWEDWIKAVKTVLSSNGPIPIELKLQPDDV